MEADLAFHRSKWFVPVGRTLYCYQDWTVAMAYHGAVYLTERHEENEEAVAACNQRSEQPATPLLAHACQVRADGGCGKQVAGG